MPVTASAPPLDLRYKFANINVLLADNDSRSAGLVHQLLTAFGFRNIKTVFEGMEVLKLLRTSRIDLIISEWALGSLNGVSLVQAIRSAKQDKLIDESIPVIMLTGRSEKIYVQQARDAGITEFLAKPFSAKTLSHRLVEVINNPREFVESASFKGPSRRRKDGPPPGIADRRLPRGSRLEKDGSQTITIRKPNTNLREMLEGTHVNDILTEETIIQAQGELMKNEDAFIAWVQDDLSRLESAYNRIAATNAPDARAELIRAAYTIKAHAGTFGYEMGTIVSDMLIRYVSEHLTSTETVLIVMRKHIDTLGVIITHRVKDANSHVGLALIDSLNKLIAKFS